MPVSRIVSLVAAAAFGAGIVVPAAVAQDAKKPAITLAVVNMIKLRRDATVMKDLKAQQDTLIKRFRAEALKERDRIRAAYKKLDKQCAVRSIQWCQRARIKANQRVREFQRLNQIRDQELRKSLNRATIRVLQETRTVVKAIAVERSLTLVMTSTGVIHYAPAYDITDEVLKRLNKALPKLKLEFPVKERGRPRPKPKPKKK